MHGRKNVDHCGENICELENSLKFVLETSDAFSINHVSNVNTGV